MHLEKLDIRKDRTVSSDIQYGILSNINVFGQQNISTAYFTLVLIKPQSNFSKLVVVHNGHKNIFSTDIPLSRNMKKKNSIDVIHSFLVDIKFASDNMFHVQYSSVHVHIKLT